MKIEEIHSRRFVRKTTAVFINYFI